FREAPPARPYWMRLEFARMPLDRSMISSDREIMCLERETCSLAMEMLFCTDSRRASWLCCWSAPRGACSGLIFLTGIRGFSKLLPCQVDYRRSITVAERI